MKWLQFVTVSVLAAISSFAAVTRDTEWQDVPDATKIGTVLDLGGGGGGGVDTNTVRDIIHQTVDGAARPLPRYLHALNFDDSYTNEAAAYYRSRGDGKVDGGCSAVRDGGYLCRNFDYPFDDRAEFVVKMSAGPNRLASVGVAQVGTNLTERIVTSGKWSKWYKALPGATVDGINECGVVAEINVVDGNPQTSGWHNDTGDLHPLAAVRWALDRAKTAEDAATNLASHIAFPSGWTQNFHYMIADETSTYIVENGSAHDVTDGVKVMTNFRLYSTPSAGEGQERYVALTNGANITSQWWTLTYTANGYRASDLPGITGEALTQLFNYWENNPRESHRGESFGDKVWWQTVHTSIYDITNRVLRVAVQEQDDWYVFQVPSSGAKVDAYTKAETDAILDNYLPLSGGVMSGGISFLPFLPVTDRPEIMADGAVYKLHYLRPGDFAGDGNEIATIGDIPTPAPTGLVWNATESAVKTANGAKTIGADDVRAYPLHDDVEIDGSSISDVQGRVFVKQRGGKSLTEYRYNGPQIDHYDGDDRYRTVYSYDKISLFYGSFRNVINFPDPKDEWPYNDTLALRGDISNALASAISATDPTFSNAVLSVEFNFATNEVTSATYIAATNVLAQLGFDEDVIANLPGGRVYGSLGALLAALAAAVALLRKKTQLLKSDGTAEDTFAADLLGKQVAKEAIDERTPYALVTGDLKDRSIKLYDATSAGVTVTLPTLATLPVGVTDFEAWIEMGATVQTVTYAPDTIEWKDGKVPTSSDYTASATNIVHFTIVKTDTATKVTACLAGFKAATPAA